MIKLDRKDRKIVELLQQNCRLTNAELADKVGLAPSSCLRRVQLLEESGLIEGFVMLVRQEQVGKPTNIFVEISLGTQRVDAFDQFEKVVRECPEIMECYLMSGASDYLMRVVAADTQDFERIHRQHLSKLPGVTRIQSNFALRTVFKRTALALPGTVTAD